MLTWLLWRLTKISNTTQKSESFRFRCNKIKPKLHISIITTQSHLKYIHIWPSNKTKQFRVILHFEWEWVRFARLSWRNASSQRDMYWGSILAGMMYCDGDCNSLHIWRRSFKISDRFGKCAKNHSPACQTLKVTIYGCNLAICFPSLCKGQPSKNPLGPHRLINTKNSSLLSSVHLSLKSITFLPLSISEGNGRDA